MASLIQRLRDAAARVPLDDVLVKRADLDTLLKDWDELNAGTDDLLRENDRLLKELGEAHKTSQRPIEPVSEMCCGGTCVRAVCFIHGDGNG